MKKIFWLVQQLERIGGTEMVTTFLASHLSADYDITLVCVATPPKELAYQLDPRLKIRYLGTPLPVVRFDEKGRELLKNHQIFSYLSLLFKLVYHFFIRRAHYRKELMKITGEDDIIIASSLDSYLFAPKKRKVIFHYHFNAKTFLTRSNRLALKLCRRPDRYIFLTAETCRALQARYPKRASTFTYIYNPCRFKRVLNQQVFDHQLLFIGRLMEQKNPALALAVANALKNDGFSFHLTLLGEGPLKRDLEEAIRRDGLQAVVTLKGSVTDVRPYLLKSDLLLVTSRFEGFPLGIIEASTYSLFTLTTDWGDAVEEVVEEGRNGTIVRSLDPHKIARKVEEIFKKDLPSLKRSSFDSAEKFSKEKILQSWKNLLG